MERLLSLIPFLFFCGAIFSQPIIIDHTCTSLNSVPVSAIKSAKQSLHIAYGHTSHGSQIITGMDKLDDFKGGTGLYNWNDGPKTGFLDIDDKFASGDLGHNGNIAWAERTRTYLNASSHADVNVVMWSWCGGVSDNTTAGIQIYLDKMNELEQAFPNITFIYMTGHSDIWNDANLKKNNKQIRDYCKSNNKVLFDFYDIERYNPDGNFFEFTNDDCSYYEDGSGSNKLGNWAVKWQNKHTKGVDWYACSAAHTHALNSNLKAYAAWWMWSRLAGWKGTTADINTQEKENINIKVYPNPASDYLQVSVSNNLLNSAMVIVDLVGKTIKSIDVDDEILQSVNIQDLKKGFYFIKSTKGDVAKFLKQ
jgi:hypothetical protein